MASPAITWRCKKTVRTQVSGAITAEMIREAFTLPDEAELTILVPGGGDWLDRTLSLDREDRVIHVEWTVENTETDGFDDEAT